MDNPREERLLFALEEGRLLLLGSAVPEVWISQELLVTWVDNEPRDEVDVTDGVITIRPHNHPPMRYQIEYWEPHARAWRARLLTDKTVTQ